MACEPLARLQPGRRLPCRRWTASLPQPLQRCFRAATRRLRLCTSHRPPAGSQAGDTVHQAQRISVPSREAPVRTGGPSPVTAAWWRDDDDRASSRLGVVCPPSVPTNTAPRATCQGKPTWQAYTARTSLQAHPSATNPCVTGRGGISNSATTDHHFRATHSTNASCAHDAACVAACTPSG